MVKNWENFFSESGGAQDNSFQFGALSWLADLGLSFGAASGAKSLLNSSRKELIEIKNRRRGMLLRKTRGSRQSYFDAGISHPTFGVERKNIYNKPSFQKLDRKYAAKTASISRNINSYKSLARIGKSIGWGYLLMGAASMAESMFTPSVSKLAGQTDLQIFQPQFNDSQAAYTQRQRALLAIHDSQMGIRNVIGSESQFFHR